MATAEYDIDPAYRDYSDGYPPDWNQRRVAVLERDKHRCQHCRLRSTRADEIVLDVDHTIPKQRGGDHSLSNLRALCPECHADRHPDNDALDLRENTKRKNFRLKFAVHNVKRLLRTFSLVAPRDSRFYVDPDGREIDVHPFRAITEFESDTCISVVAKVVDLWDVSSDRVFQSGLVADPDDADADPVKFVTYGDSELRRLHEHETYLFVGAKTSTYNHRPELSCDAKTEITVTSKLRI